MKDDTDVYRNIFHNELSNALRDIRKEYEEQMKNRPSNDELYQARVSYLIFGISCPESKKDCVSYAAHLSWIKESFWVVSINFNL